MKNETTKNAIDKQLNENKIMRNINKQFQWCQREIVSSTCRKEDVFYKKLTNADYICDICQIIFKQKNKILRYIMSKHSFHRPFRCAVCVKSFEYKYDLKMHWLIHQKVDSNSLYCCSNYNYDRKRVIWKRTATHRRIQIRLRTLW